MSMRRKARVNSIGLLNLIGAQRGLKPSETLLRLLFDEAAPELLRRLESVSTIHFRSYSQEYHVWQGSDFDLAAALREATAEQAQLSLVDTLNRLAPLPPLVARRATIESATPLDVGLRKKTTAEWMSPRRTPADKVPTLARDGCARIESAFYGAPGYLSNDDRETAELNGLPEE